jgi:hypothetical protein
MRRLHRYRITGSSLIESARRSSPNQHDPEHAFAILATLAPLADAAFEIDSDGDPIRFVIEHGVLTCRDLDRLESERAWCVLGGGALSPALEFVDAWNRGSPADWRLIARALKAAHDDPVELRDRWLRTVLAAPFSEAEGPAPVPLRPFHNPCPGCLARAELRRLRDTVGAHAEDERRCA